MGGMPPQKEVGAWAAGGPYCGTAWYTCPCCTGCRGGVRGNTRMERSLEGRARPTASGDDGRGRRSSDSAPHGGPQPVLPSHLLRGGRLEVSRDVLGRRCGRLSSGRRRWRRRLALAGGHCGRGGGADALRHCLTVACPRPAARATPQRRCACHPRLLQRRTSLSDTSRAMQTHLGSASRGARQHAAPAWAPERRARSLLPAPACCI